jgi:hypothetical protein
VPPSTEIETMPYQDALPPRTVAPVPVNVSVAASPVFAL